MTQPATAGTVVPARPDRIADFEAFVAARSPRLLTTAYLLTHDRGRAEDLLQTSLAKLWLAWSRAPRCARPVRSAYAAG